MTYCANKSDESTLRDSPYTLASPDAFLEHAQDAGMIRRDKRFSRVDEFAYKGVTKKASAQRRKNPNKEPTFALVPLVLLVVLSLCGILFAAPPVLKQIGFVLTRVRKNHEISYPARVRQPESESTPPVSGTSSKCHCGAKPAEL